jgi:FkbM family methyltransferase
MQRAKTWLHIVLPWPMVAWCERLYFAQFGEIELCMVKHLCRPDQDSIDVGANVGTYLHAMMRHSDRVYAFEPVPWLAQLLPKKFGRKVVVENLALSHETSRALLHIPVVDGTPVTGLSTLSDDLAARTALYRDIPVETRPLDEVYSGNVGFIKIDVEGHEHSVLRGARSRRTSCTGLRATHPGFLSPLRLSRVFCLSAPVGADRVFRSSEDAAERRHRGLYAGYAACAVRALHQQFPVSAARGAEHHAGATGSGVDEAGGAGRRRQPVGQALPDRDGLQRHLTCCMV